MRIAVAPRATCGPSRGPNHCRGNNEPAAHGNGQNTGDGQCVKVHNRASYPGHAVPRWEQRLVSPTDVAVLEDVFHAVVPMDRNYTSYELVY